jgi:hypothetical protein
MSTVARPCAGTASVYLVGVRSSTLCDRPSPEITVTCTGRCAGAVIVGGFRPPPGTIVNVAGIRASSGGTPPDAGAPGFVVVSVPVGGVPVAVSEVVRDAVRVAVRVAVWVPLSVVLRVAGGVAPAAVLVVDALRDADVPHPTVVASNRTHKRTGIPLTFAG